MEAARRPIASALSALAGTLRGKFSNRQGHSKGAFPLTSKRGPRDFYKGKGAKSTGTLTKKGACVRARVWALTRGAPGRDDSFELRVQRIRRTGHGLKNQRQALCVRVCIHLCHTVLRCRAWRVRSHRNVGRRHLCCAAPQARGVCCARSGRM